MKNGEKYKTPGERAMAFNEYCNSKLCQKCYDDDAGINERSICLLKWLDLEAEKELSMSKQYTADEIREIADEIGLAHDDIHEKAASMLNQAADALDGEDERETKFEYAVLWDYDNSLFVKSMDYSYVKQKMDEVNADGPACHLVRRSVGEWEEVPK